MPKGSRENNALFARSIHSGAHLPLVQISKKDKFFFQSICVHRFETHFPQWQGIFSALFF